MGLIMLTIYQQPPEALSAYLQDAGYTRPKTIFGYICKVAIVPVLVSKPKRDVGQVTME